MIKLTATAIVHYISPVIEIPSKTPGGQGFTKRELVLDDSWTKDGVTHPNFVTIEFSGDKMFQLDNFTQGQRVTVEAYVNGREHQGRYFNSIKGQSVTLYVAQQTGSNAGQHVAAAPGGYPQQPAYPPQPAYPQQPAYPPQPQYAQHGGYAQQGAPMPTAGAVNNNLGPSNLPY